MRERRVEVLLMKRLMKTLGVSVMDRIRNWNIRKGCGNKKSFLEQMNESVLNGAGHMDKVDEERHQLIIERIGGWG